MTTLQVRTPAVAGTFYPADPMTLAQRVDRCLQDGAAQLTRLPNIDPLTVRALVVPHAGYVYSGPIAGTGYALAARLRDQVTSVLVLGPAHYVPVRGVAVSGANGFATPLGVMPVDDEARESVVAASSARISDAPHLPEHSLEVQLPFLQRSLGDVAILPLVVGQVDPDDVAALVAPFLQDPRWLVVVSSDLSHYLPYDAARERDERTARAIGQLRWRDISDHDACGAWPLRGLLVAGAKHDLGMRLLDLRNSGDTAGTRDRVVGYGAFAALEGGAS